MTCHGSFGCFARRESNFCSVFLRGHTFWILFTWMILSTRMPWLQSESPHQLRWASIRLAEARAQVASVVDDISGLRSIPKLRTETNAPLHEAIQVPVDKVSLLSLSNACSGINKLWFIASLHQVSGSADGGKTATPQVVQITYPNLHEFDKVPKYMKGERERKLEFANRLNAYFQF